MKRRAGYHRWQGGGYHTLLVRQLVGKIARRWVEEGEVRPATLREYGKVKGDVRGSVGVDVRRRLLEIRYRGYRCCCYTSTRIKGASK